MGSFIKERLIFAYCWTHWIGRCENCTCCYTFSKCKNFADLRSKIHAIGIITRQKRKIQLRLLSSEKELIVKIYSLWKSKDIIMQ